MDRRQSLEQPALQALARMRALALSEAQSDCEAHARALLAREATRDECTRSVEQSYATLREQLTRPFSIDTFMQGRRYALAQLLAREAAASACEQARTELQRAQGQVKSCLEELKAVERLHSRRREESLREIARGEQWRLDELGLIKAWHAQAHIHDADHSDTTRDH